MMLRKCLIVFCLFFIILSLASFINASTIILCSDAILAYDTVHSLSPIRPPNASDVLVVYNMNYLIDDNSNGLNDSEEIAEYYISARGIPESNICPINTSANEEIERAEYDSAYDTEEEYSHHIKQGIETCIDTNGVRDSIRFIVLIKGIPLKINDSLSNVYNSSRFPRYDYSSIDSALTMVFQNISNHSSNVYNTYRDESFVNGDSRDDRHFFIDYPIDCKLPGDTFEYKGYVISYLVSRIDGYNTSQIFSSIDRSVAADTSGQKQWVLDDDPDATGTGSDRMSTANTKLSALNLSSYITYNNTNEAILSSSQVNDNPVIGYSHHGVYDSNLGNNFIYNGLIQFPLANGSIMMGWESFNGLSFRNSDSTTHNLIADWIMIGGTAGIGSVYEPGSQAIPYESSLFSSYAMGYTFIESAYFSLRYLDFTATVAGDPLMQISEYPTIRSQYFVSTYISSYNNNYTINALSVSPSQNVNSSWRIYKNSSIMREEYAERISDYVSRFLINFTGLAEDDYEVILILNLSNGSVETLLFNVSSDLPTVVTTSFSENQVLYADNGNLTLNVYVPEDTLVLMVLELDKASHPGVWQFFSLSAGNHSINFTNVSAGPHRITMTNAELDLIYQIYTYDVYVVTNISRSRMVSQFNTSLSGNLNNIIITNINNLSINEGNMSLLLDVLSGDDSIFVEIPLFNGIYAAWESSFRIITNLSDTNVTNSESYLGLNFASVALVNNISSFLNETYFLNGARITFQQINGTFPVYIENDNGTPVHKLSLCESGSPNGTINLSTMCYLNTTENITLYLPHFSGGGLANDSSIPNISFQNTLYEFNDSFMLINLSIYEHTPSENFCVINISGENIIYETILSSEFDELTDHTYSLEKIYDEKNTGEYDISILCTDEYNNSGYANTTVLINDSTIPLISTIIASGDLEDYNDVDYIIYFNTSELADCRYSFSHKNYSQSTYLFDANQTLHQKQFSQTSSEDITYYITCSDINNLESEVKNITLDIIVLTRRSGGGSGQYTNIINYTITENKTITNASTLAYNNETSIHVTFEDNFSLTYEATNNNTLLINNITKKNSETNLLVKKSFFQNYLWIFIELVIITSLIIIYRIRIKNNA